LIGKSATTTTTLSIAELPKEGVRCTCIRRSKRSYVTQFMYTVVWCCSKSVLAQNFTALIQKVHSPAAAPIMIRERAARYVLSAILSFFPLLPRA
jgi:hypothetical protein